MEITYLDDQDIDSSSDGKEATAGNTVVWGSDGAKIEPFKHVQQRYILLFLRLWTKTVQTKLRLLLLMALIIYL